MAIVSPYLASTNYHSQSKSMITTLSAKNKVQFINGSAPQPSQSDRTHGAWIRCNNVVVSWLVHFVSSSILQSILWMDCAEEIWHDLKSRYFQGDLLRISAMQLEAYSIKQGDLSVADFFTQLRIIQDELENFLLDPVFTCNVICTCKVSSIIAQHKLENQAMQFRCGLNEQYTNVRSHILLLDPLPPITKIFSYVAQQERQLLLTLSLLRPGMVPLMLLVLILIAIFMVVLDILKILVIINMVFPPILITRITRVCLGVKNLHSLWQDWSYYRCVL